MKVLYQILLQGKIDEGGSTSEGGDDKLILEIGLSKTMVFQVIEQAVSDIEERNYGEWGTADTEKNFYNSAEVYL